MLRLALRLIPIVMVMPLTSGCVVAVREVAVARHKSNTVSQVQKDFPPGTPIETIRSTMTARAYNCTDVNIEAASVLQCDPTQRSGAIFKGNWRLSFTNKDGRLENVRASKSPKPPKTTDGNRADQSSS